MLLTMLFSFASIYKQDSYQDNSYARTLKLILDRLSLPYAPFYTLVTCFGRKECMAQTLIPIKIIPSLFCIL